MVKALLGVLKPICVLVAMGACVWYTYHHEWLQAIYCSIWVRIAQGGKDTPV